MSETDRDESGRFTGSVSEQDILIAFDTADAPFLTASELADELSISRQAANYRLKRMRKDGIVDRKKTGSRAAGWWATVAPRLSKEAKQRADAADRDNAHSLEDLEARFENN